MNPKQIDALARRIATSRETRRNLFKRLGLGGIGVAAAGMRAAKAEPAAFDAAPRRNYQTGAGTLIDELAFDLEYDRDQIIDFVTKEIRFEPYSGALRGPMGTIYAGAGNATDKSQLLVALLQASQIEAAITTNADAPGDLISLWQAGQASPFPARIANAVLTFSGVDPSMAEGTPIATADAARTDLAQKAQTRIANAITQLATTMQKNGVDITDRTGADAGRGDWHSVLIASGAEQVAVDVVTGATKPSAATTASEPIADEQFHVVTIRVIAEVISGTGTQRTTLLETPLRSQDTVGQSIALIHLDGSDMSAIGLDLGNLLGGTVAYTPVLIAGQDFFYGTSPMRFGGQGGVISVLDPNAVGGATDGEPVAEYLEIEIRSPGFDPKVISRTIFDRIADQRESGSYDFSNLTPIDIIDLGGDFKRYLPVASLIAFAILPGDLPPGYSVIPDPLATPVQTFANAAKGVQSVRQQLLNSIATSGVGGYINRPNVIAYSYAPFATSATAYESVKISADVIFAQTTGISADDLVPYGLVAGVTTQVAERTALDPDIFKLIDPSPGSIKLPEVDPISVGAIFEMADETDVGLLVIKTANDLSQLPADLPASAVALIKAHIDSNETVITPRTRLAIGGATTTGWWVFDSSSGHWYDELENGSGGYMYDGLGGYAVLLRNVIVARAPYLLLAECIAAIASAANDLLSSSYWSALAGAVANYNVCK